MKIIEVIKSPFLSYEKHVHYDYFIVSKPAVVSERGWTVHNMIKKGTIVSLFESKEMLIARMSNNLR